MLIWASLAFAAEGALTEPAPTTHVVVLPNLSFDTDDGLGFGARMEITRVKPGIDPYLASYVLHFYGSLEGYHHHRFRFDLPHLPQNQRLTGYLAFRAWLHNGYWGIGNGSVRNPDDPDAYQYSLIQPYARLTLSRRINGPWSLFGALQGTWSGVDASEGSLLAQDQPYGMGGGWSGQLTVGARWDTRKPEVTPKGGGLMEVAIRGAVGDSFFGGAFWSGRAYAKIVPRLTWATRTMVEYLFGEVPFYEMNQWSGWIPVNGMGGSDSLRGLPSGRLLGPGKWVWNNELRIDVLEHSLFHRPLRWELVPFVDVGAVFGADGPSPDGLPVFPGVGGGIRAIYDTTLVVRIDSACGWDRVPDGRAPLFGFYVVFDHTF